MPPVDWRARIEVQANTFHLHVTRRGSKPIELAIPQQLAMKIATKPGGRRRLREIAALLMSDSKHVPMVVRLMAAAHTDEDIAVLFNATHVATQSDRREAAKARRR